MPQDYISIVPPTPRVDPPQMYHVWIFWSNITQQYYYYASLKRVQPAIMDIKAYFTVKARSEHDAVARVMTEGYETKDWY